MKQFKIIASALAVVLCAAALSSADSPDQKRAKTRKMVTQTLQDLY
jgi:hypothetical protein